MANGPLPPYPEGHKYYGPFVAETLTDGWCYGAITEFLRPDLPGGCDSGDGFVVAPDGSYCGLVWWRECPWASRRIRTPRNDDFWGIFEVRFPFVVRMTDDLVTNFRHILPRLKKRYQSWIESTQAAPQFLGQPRSTVLRLPDSTRLRASPATFWHICRANPDLRLERTSLGGVEVFPPVASVTGAINCQLSGRLGVWNREAGLGKAFGSDLGYTLPNGAIRSPDASWIPLDQFQRLTREQRRGFIPFAPTFAAELRSRGDRLDPLRRKMREYCTQGTRLGWLIDLVRQRVEIYRTTGPVEILDHPTSLSGGDILPGFKLDMNEILDDHEYL